VVVVSDDVDGLNFVRGWAWLCLSLTKAERRPTFVFEGNGDSVHLFGTMIVYISSDI
jgi:hypothetical protein